MALRRRKGVWYIDVRYVDETGKRRRLCRSTGRKTTKEEAGKVHKQLMKELTAGNPTLFEILAGEDQEPIPFSGFAKKWYDDYVIPNNKPSEAGSKESIFRVHLAPFFGDTDIRSITAEQIEHFKAVKAMEVSKKRVNNILTVLRTMFAYATTWDYLDKSPMDKVKQFKVADADFDFYDKDEMRLFLECVDLEWYPFFLLGFRTGMRLGELFALRWVDVDFKNNRIIVRRNYVKGKFGTPKSGKSRIIPMSPQLSTVLAKYRHSENELVFYYKKDGSPLERNRVKHPFWRTIEKSGLRLIDLHEMRDSFASQLVMEGRSLKEVQELLGHSDIRMTMKYAHLSPGYLEAAVCCLDDDDWKADKCRAEKVEESAPRLQLVTVSES